MAGFWALRTLLLAVAFLAVASTARALRTQPWAVLLVAPLVLAIVWGRLEFRCLLFTRAVLAVELWLLIGVHVGKLSRRWLWAFPP